MGWADFKTDLLAEWARLSGPGLYVFAGLGAAACAIWLLMNSRYGSMIASLREPGEEGRRSLARLRSRSSRHDDPVPRRPTAFGDWKATWRNCRRGAPRREAEEPDRRRRVSAGWRRRTSPLSTRRPRRKPTGSPSIWSRRSRPPPAGTWSTSPIRPGCGCRTVGVAVALTDPAKPTATEHLLVLMALQDAKVTHRKSSPAPNTAATPRSSSVRGRTLGGVRRNSGFRSFPKRFSSAHRTARTQLLSSTLGRRLQRGPEDPRFF